jgi:glucokinase
MFFGKKNKSKNIEVTLGVDIGGTDTALGYVDRQGQCVGYDTIPTYAHQSAEILFERVRNRAEWLLTDLKEKYTVVGIGITAPNANYNNGSVQSPPNLNWEYVNVKAEVWKYYHLPIAVTNQANAIALGEMLFGAAQGMKDFIVITLGENPGSGIVTNGNLLFGMDGNAGEIGHTIVDLQGRECGCGRRGCLITYVSAAGLCKTIQNLIQTTSHPSNLRSLDTELVTPQMIYEAALRGDRLALEAFNYTGKILGLKLADTVAHISPEAIILVGGLAGFGDMLFRPTKQSMEEHLLTIFKNKVKLLPSGLINTNVAIIGASALIWHDILRFQKISGDPVEAPTNFNEYNRANER